MTNNSKPAQGTWIRRGSSYGVIVAVHDEHGSFFANPWTIEIRYLSYNPHGSTTYTATEYVTAPEWLTGKFDWETLSP